MLRYISEFRDAPACRVLADQVRELGQSAGDLNFMEFCGGHTHAIMRNGIRQCLPGNVRMSAGPGCPVCVTAQQDIDAAISLAGHTGVTVATFGDMMRVPGSRGSLQEANASGADVRLVYSVMDALKLAASEPARDVVFFAVGFETTAPGTAAAVLQAQAGGLTNFRVLSLHKLTPPAMRAIIEAGEVRISGVLGPGHVTTIIGANAWSFLPRDYGLGCVISGFEPADLLLAVSELLRMAVEHRPRVVNSYQRSATATGNLAAQAIMARVFQPAQAAWRGFGSLPESGLKLRPEFAAFDAEVQYDLDITPVPEPAGCRCGEVLRGVMEPPDCPMFGTACTPESPVGPCMVSSEGACSAYYEFGGGDA
jgi:hydrogenase expression/formation protein HypD